MKDHADYQRKKNLSHDRKVSEAIDRISKRILEHNRKNGHDISYEQARREAVDSAERVERKRQK